MKLNLSSFALTLALAAPFVSAGLFPTSGDSKVKMLNPKEFKKVMKEGHTSLVAFVAPWCGHCQRLVPEYMKAAKSLDPMVPLYAVDCDAEENKRICAEQGVQGFPTVKLFPQGGEQAPMPYNGERTAKAIHDWTARRVPTLVKKLKEVTDIAPWIESDTSKPRLLLLTKDKKVPLLWKVLANNFRKRLSLGVHKDEDGEAAEALGYAPTGKSMVLVFPEGETRAVVYEGKMKLAPLTGFFKSILDGTADMRLPEDEPVAVKTSEKSSEDAANHEPAAVNPDQVILDETPLDVKAEQTVVVDEPVVPTPGHETPAEATQEAEHPKDEL
ncbi:thioredoxin-like protein [Schizophyllum commune]